jgi:hypothetical protein
MENNIQQGVTEEVIAFLLGEGELDGKWFGSGNPEGKAPFWWRTKLRAFKDQLSFLTTELEIANSHKALLAQQLIDKNGELQSVKEDNQRLREALDKIRNPIKHFQATAEAQGAQFNGQMANQLSNSASYLKEIAEQALKI